MRKIIFTFLLASLCLFCNAQSVTINEVYYNHKKLLCSKKNNKPYSGTYKGATNFRYNIAQMHILWGKLHTISPEGVGQYIDVNELILYGNINKGKEEGKWQYYLNDSTLLYEINFVKGKFDGFFVQYYPNGKVRSIWHYRNGKQEDIHILFDEDEKMTSKKLFAD